jgi:hypothetical protein
MKFGNALVLPIPLRFLTNMDVMAWIRETSYLYKVNVCFFPGFGGYGYGDVIF